MATMNDNTAPEPPETLGAAGLADWYAVVEHFEIEPWEVGLLVQICTTADTLASLTAAVGGQYTDEKGHIRPEVVELRAQKITYARLKSALRIPLGDAVTDEKGSSSPTPKRLQRRSGARGVYAV